MLLIVNRAVSEGDEFAVECSTLSASDGILSAFVGILPTLLNLSVSPTFSLSQHNLMSSMFLCGLKNIFIFLTNLSTSSRIF